MSWLKKSVSILTLVCLFFQLFFAVVDPAYAEEGTTPAPEPQAVDSSTSQTQTPAADPSTPNPFFEPIGSGIESGNLPGSADVLEKPSSLDADANILPDNSQSQPEEPQAENFVSPMSLTPGTESTVEDQASIGLGACKNCDIKISNGTFNYSLEIKVPTGRNSLNPYIILDYSQLNTNIDSIVGYGWDLNYGGYIERTGKKGVNEGFGLNEYKLALGGNSGELVAVDLNDNIHGRFGERVENSFSKYEYLTDGSWKITDTKGTKFYLGRTAGSRQDDSASSTKIFKWMLDKVEDANGNYITYEYFKDENQIYPSIIKYTGHDTDEGIYEIDFLRETKTDNPKIFNSGFSVKPDYRISEIDIKVNGRWTKKYSLTYGTGGNGTKSLLASVTETGQDDDGDQISLPPVEIEYQQDVKILVDNENYDLPMDIVTYDGVDLGVRQLDYNGDGLPDIVQSKTGYNKLTYLNNGNGWTEDLNCTVPVDFVSNIGSDLGVRFADVNGDGLVDILRAFAGASKKIYVNKGDGTGWEEDSNYTLPVDFVTNLSNDLGVRLEDVNGDGLVDILVAFTGSPHHVYINKGDGTGWEEDVDYVVPVDFVSNRSEDIGTRLADVNNDGLVDILQAKAGSPHHVYINKGDGVGWEEDSNYDLSVNFVTNLGTDLGVRFGDINGDGLIDVLQAGQADYVVWGVYLNNGDGTGWTKNDGYYMPMVFESWGQDAGVRILDIDGNGMIDLIKSQQTQGGGTVRNSYMLSPEKADLLSKIKLDTGGEIKVGYKSTPKITNASSTLLNTDLPAPLEVVAYINFNDGNGNLATTTYVYADGKYYFDSTDPFMRKFAGFHTVKTTDDEGNYVIQYFHQGNETSTSTGEFEDHFSKIGRMYREEIYDKDEELFKVNINKFDKEDLGNGRYFSKLARSLTIDYDGNSSYKAKAQSFYYDNYGNLAGKVDYGEVGSINDSGDFTDIGTDLASTSISYVLNTSANIVSLPARETLYDYDGNKIKDSKYYYDNLSSGNVDKGNLTKEENWKSGTGYIDAEKIYNNYGLVTQEKDPRDKTTSYIYDAYNLFVATSTNPLSQSFAYDYDYATGKVKRKVDPNKNIFETIYDGLGRPLAEMQPDIATSSQVMKTGYEYNDTDFPKMIKMIDYFDASSSIDSYVYYDGFDRKIQERKRAEDDNTYSVKDYVYDNRGSLAIETLPYFSTGTAPTGLTASSSLYTRNTYDTLGRVISASNIIATTTTGYDDWKVTITDGEGKTKDLYKDAYDNLVQVDEHNGASTYSTYYQYNLLGNLTKITDALGNVRNFTYDGLGRRLTAEDLHAQNDATYGTWTYTFDDSGNLTSRIDPKNQTVNYTYDDLNRVLTENYTGSAGTEVSYGYDSCQNGVGLMCSATTTASVLNLDYNALGLVSAENKTIVSATYQTQYSYDRQGNQTIITLPDNTQVKNEYNPAGWLEKVSKKLPSDPSFVYIVEDIDYNPLGQRTHEDFANGTESNYVYDQDQLYRLSRKQSTIATTSLQDLNYTYDKVGNITQIIDSSNTNTAKTSNFAYDDLYRLISASSTNAVYGGNFNESYSYNAIGNITNKSNVGNYLYQNTNYANPHAATNINGVTYSYDNNGNLTSDGTWTHTWDYDNRLTQSQQGTSTPVTYTYDQDGNRVKKIENGVTGIYINKYFEVDNGLSKRHIFANEANIATLEDETFTTGCMPPVSGDWTISSSCYLRTSAKAPGNVIVNAGAVLTIATSSILEIDLKHFKLLVKKGGGVKIKKGSRVRQTTAQILPPTVHTDTIFHYTDHLSGNSIDTDQNGNILETIDYLPFGSVRIDLRSGSHENNYKFTGKELDNSTNLYYFGARYYSGNIGRWTSEDPAFLAIGNNQEFREITKANLEKYLSDPQALNSYNYSRNNPLIFKDTNGKWIEKIIGEKRAYVIGNWANNLYSKSGLAKFAMDHPLVTGVVAGVVGAAVGEVASAVGTAVGSAAGAGYKIAETAINEADKMKAVYESGKNFLAENGYEQSIKQIESLTKTAKYRIPDVIDESNKIITEVKNVNYQSFTSQIEDFYLYSQKYGYQFQLFTRQDTIFSKPLQNLINSGQILWNYPK